MVLFEWIKSLCSSITDQFIFKLNRGKLTQSLVSIEKVLEINVKTASAESEVEGGDLHKSLSTFHKFFTSDLNVGIYVICYH